ncbi:MAG: ribose 5-phosphate isomerase B [Candidatus Omnitrophica bacterium]|nr:ribose 5-phosphate isomerase B [Candidatus Omnitrophota bacterium]
MDSKILIASDHGGIKLKADLVKFLKKLHVSVNDLGTNTEDSVDYPDYAIKLAKSVGKSKNQKGILICKSGIGMAISANKVRGVRAALCLNKKMAELSRQHNNSNILVLGAAFVPSKKAEGIVKAWLATQFEGGRHEKRIKKITDYEGKR